MKKIASIFGVVVVTMFLFSPIAQAKYVGNLNAKNVRQEVLKVAKGYIEAVACPDGEDASDYTVFAISPYTEVKDDTLLYSKGEYGVIWSGDSDAACEGNSSSPHLTIVTIFNDKVVVVPEDSNFTEIERDFSKFMEIKRDLPHYGLPPVGDVLPEGLFASPKPGLPIGVFDKVFSANPKTIVIYGRAYREGDTHAGGPSQKVTLTLKYDDKKGWTVFKVENRK
ncbi:MAG: hypothetical protein LBQ81_02770 [Zoogloeaceae bacterium]|jgi:hypothetical protein|nr:hypothetical protein [Zoogloeaceae bacterium]